MASETTSEEVEEAQEVSLETDENNVEANTMKTTTTKPPAPPIPTSRESLKNKKKTEDHATKAVVASTTTTSASEIVVQPPAHHGAADVEGDVSKPETLPKPSSNDKEGTTTTTSSSTTSTFLPKVQIGSFNESTTNYRKIIKQLWREKEEDEKNAYINVSLILNVLQ